MARDRLFLLPPGFHDNGRREYCPECAELWGVLNYYPAIRESLDIIYEPIAHPRPALTAALGPGKWNCPTLILDDNAPAPQRAKAGEAHGLRYLASARAIGQYYAERFGIAVPRGS